MSVPKNSGSQPFAPLSTPGASTEVAQTPTTDYESNSKSWSTIPGLGSAVKPLRSTPLSVTTDSPLLPGLGSKLPEDQVPPSFANALRSVPRAPPKTAGAAPTDWQSFLDKRIVTSTGATAGPSAVSASASQPLQGHSSASQSFNGTDAAPGTTSPSSVKWTQTKGHHDSDVSPALLQNASRSPRTAPVPQTGFHAFSDCSFNERDDSTVSACTDPTGSEPSTNLSEHYLKQHPEQGDLQAPTWIETANPRGIRNALKDPKAEWEETFTGSLQILRQLNPAKYEMPFGVSVAVGLRKGRAAG